MSMEWLPITKAMPQNETVIQTFYTAGTHRAIIYGMIFRAASQRLNACKRIFGHCGDGLQAARC